MHIHNTLLLLSPAVVRAAKRCGVPVVQTLHNFRLFCPNGILLRDGARLRGLPPPRPALRTAAPLLPRQSGADPCGRRVLPAAPGAGQLARRLGHDPDRV